MIVEHGFLLSNVNKISHDYNNKIDILSLSKKYNGSPLNIMRIVLSKTNTKKQVKQLFNKPKLLNEYDNKQFIIAKNSDDFALVNQDETLKKATEFEKDIELILKKLNIKYKTQEELTEEQIISHGRAFSTPDFLIESELIINNKKINWIDAKNFYGSDIKFVKSNIDKQTEKYIKNYGSGCIIFKSGFNEKYQNPNILFLSYKSFNV
jgi:hypothetical protein